MRIPNGAKCSGCSSLTEAGKVALRGGRWEGGSWT